MDAHEEKTHRDYHEKRVWVLQTNHGPYRFTGTRLEASCLFVRGYWSRIWTAEEFAARLPQYPNPFDHGSPPPWTVMDLKPGQHFRWAGDDSDQVYLLGAIADERGHPHPEILFLVGNGGGAMRLDKLSDSVKQRTVELVRSFGPEMDENGCVVSKLPPSPY